MSFSHRKSLSFLIFLTFFLGVSLTPILHASVRRDKFNWMTVQTEHFEIYYDKSTEQMVPRMAHHLENAWTEVGATYDFQVQERTPFFFYSNHNEFEQTSIVEIGEGTGGVTEAFKNRFIVFNDGSDEWLKHVIYHEFAHVVQFNVLYGGWWKSVKLLKSPFFPLWMMEGMAEFASKDIDDATGDMVVRDAYIHKQLPPLAELHGFSHLKPNQVTLGYKTGDAAITFLQEEYGADKLPLLLHAMNDYFDISSALQATLGVPDLGCDLSRFDFRFQEWLEDKYGAFRKEAKSPLDYGPKLTPLDPLPQFNEAPVISHDGKMLYYFSDKGGPHQVHSLDLESGKSKVLIPLLYGKYENLHTRGRGLSLSADGETLAFSGEHEQRDFLYLYNLKKGKLKRVKIPFDELRTPVFSPTNNDQLVCVGMMRGFNDIYLIDRKAQIIERLTNTPQDEKDPIFSPEADRIYFSGEVISKETSEPMWRNIFSIDIKTKELSQITDHMGSESEPEVLPDQSIIYVRDRNDQEKYGFNLIRRDASGKETQLTNLIGGGFSPRYSTANNALYYVGFNAGEKHVYTSTQIVAGSPVASNEISSDDFMGVGEARKPSTSQALLNWPSQSGSPLFSTVGRPYRFKASTDLFIPFFFYSSVDGFVLMDVWQFSDYLGHHQFQQQAQYASGGNTMDLSAIYTYARYRPTFTVGVRSLRYYRDFDENSLRREITGIGYMTYPLDRTSSISLGAGSTNRDDTFHDEIEPDNKLRDRFLISTWQYNTITGRYLIPTKGNRLAFVYQQGLNTMGGMQRYKTGLVEGAHYIPLPRESTIASRLFLGRSTGEERQVFRLGGFDRVRALPAGGEANKKSNVAMASTELRFRIKYLDARTAFLFPDFFFKAAYLVVFDDIGYGWDNGSERSAFETNKLENSFGMGVYWPTFILQSYQMNIGFQWAHRSNTGSDVWYISVGPSF